MYDTDLCEGKGNFLSLHAMTEEAGGGGWGVLSHILNLSWRRMFSFKPRLLTSEDGPQHPLNRRAWGPQNRPVCFGKEKNLFPVPEIWSRFFGRPVCSWVTLPTERFFCPLIFRNILPWISIITAVYEGRHVPVTLWLTDRITSSLSNS
jgi:hypothetical protein